MRPCEALGEHCGRREGAGPCGLVDIEPLFTPVVNEDAPLHNGPTAAGSRPGSGAVTRSC